MITPDNLPDEADKEQINKLTKRADQLSNFGTLTSLVSTAAYFVENTLVKKLPKWVNVATLSAVGVGIASVISSYYFKFKAGRVALNATIKTENTAPPEIRTATNTVEDQDGATKWTKEMGTAQDPSSTLRR